MLRVTPIVTVDAAEDETAIDPVYVAAWRPVGLTVTVRAPGVVPLAGMTESQLLAEDALAVNGTE